MVLPVALLLPMKVQHVFSVLTIVHAVIVVHAFFTNDPI